MEAFDHGDTEITTKTQNRSVVPCLHGEVDQRDILLRELPSVPSVKSVDSTLPLVVDAHEDIAWNALTFGRDYTRSALAIREAERNSEAPSHNGSAMLGLNEWRLGRVGVIFSTLFASPIRRALGPWDTQAYADAGQAHRRYSAQLDYYHRLVDEHPQFSMIQTVADLDEVLTSWEGPDPAGRRVGLVVLMEGADAVREPKEVEAWMERGVRIVGPAWTGTRYSGGTGEPGPLTREGRELLDEMAGLGLILDLSHMAEASCLESLDRFEGTVLASHANPRALMKDARRPDRFLTDDMIRRLAERGGVIGVVPFNRFLSDAWTDADGKAAVTIDTVAAHIDHVCQVVGDAAHVGIGSDFDGGFGLESSPAEIDTVADLLKLAEPLRRHGYGETDVQAILGGNWIQLLRRGLPA